MLNFTDAEYEALARAAEDTIPSYARELVLRALAAEKSRPEPTSKAPARRKA